MDYGIMFGIGFAVGAAFIEVINRIELRMLREEIAKLYIDKYSR